MPLVEFTEYNAYGDTHTKVRINPQEVAAVREWQYHSFRPAISEIILKSGKKIRTWEDVDCVTKKLAKEKG